jgi:hypothetical protein
MNLSDHNKHWTEFLASEQCPPVLGLAPMTDAEKDTVGVQVHEHLSTIPSGASFDHLLRLIDLHPGVMTVWLLRIAGEAYHEGNFWSNFEQALGVSIPTQRRNELIRSLKQNAFLISEITMSSPQIERGKHRRWMMWQAGLPLCHAGNFATAVRWVERNLGLPDTARDTCGEELQESLLQYKYLSNWPILKQAIIGPAGPVIAEAALRIVFQDDAPPINPRISDELQKAFRSSRIRSSAQAVSHGRSTGRSNGLTIRARRLFRRVSDPI